MLISFNYGNSNFGRPGFELALPVGHQRLGADQQYIANVARSQQHPDRRNGLHGFSQPHFIGQNRVVSWEQKSDTSVLKREWLERKFHRPVGQQVLQRRLQQVEKSIFQLDYVARRFETRSSTSFFGIRFGWFVGCVTYIVR